VLPGGHLDDAINIVNSDRAKPGAKRLPPAGRCFRRPLDADIAEMHQGSARTQRVSPIQNALGALSKTDALRNRRRRRMIEAHLRRCAEDVRAHADARH
jgi:hypothetical protein